MDIQAEKIALVKMVLDTNNPKTLQSIKNLLKGTIQPDFWDELSTVKQKEINNASKELEEGKTTNYESFIAKHR